MIVDGAVAAEAAGFWCGVGGRAPLLRLHRVGAAGRPGRDRRAHVDAPGRHGGGPRRQQRPHQARRGLRHARRALGRQGRAGRWAAATSTSTRSPPSARIRSQSRRLYEERVALLVEALHGEQLQWDGRDPAAVPQLHHPAPAAAGAAAGLGGWRLLAGLRRVRRQGRAAAHAAGRPRPAPVVRPPRRALPRALGRARPRPGPAARSGPSPTPSWPDEPGGVRHGGAPHARPTWAGWASSSPSARRAMAGFVKETSLEVLVERGPTVCGSPEQVVDKMGTWREHARPRRLPGHVRPRRDARRRARRDDRAHGQRRPPRLPGRASGPALTTGGLLASWRVRSAGLAGIGSRRGGPLAGRHRLRRRGRSAGAGVRCPRARARPDRARQVADIGLYSVQVRPDAPPAAVLARRARRPPG